MEKQYLIQLTQSLYRLTLLFPKKEPLRYKMRELAVDLLAETIRIKHYGSPTLAGLESGSLKTLEYLGVLDGFFEMVKTQNWVAKQDILNIQSEYSKLDGELRGQVSLFGQVPQSGTKVEDEVAISSPAQPLETVVVSDNRQERILSFLKENGRAQVWQVKQILPEVTKRTLRRDFDRLLDQGVVERMGERNDTFYQLKVNEI